jgi:hypothetical protein
MVEMDIKVNLTYNTVDNKAATAVYIIPNNSTKIDTDASKCSETEENLVVRWQEGNNFSMTFKLQNGSYDLSNFVISINTSSVFNNSVGEQSNACMSDFLLN